MTAAFAIWGAVLSTSLGLLQLLTYWRDRPRLYISSHTDQRRDRHPAIGLDVSNRGRQTTTLMEVGFFAEVRTT